MTDLRTLKNGDPVEGLFAVQSKEGPREGLRDYSNKPGQFFVIRVGNSTGSMTLKYWGAGDSDRAATLFSTLEVSDVISVKGRCVYDTFSRELVISVNEEVKYGQPEEHVKKVELESYSPEEFIPSLPAERIAELNSEMQTMIESVQNQHLKALLRSFFNDTAFTSSFKQSPAAKKIHHNYLGGLLEHTVNVAKLCLRISELYPLDRELLLTGALLHDIGKTREYRVSTTIEVTTEGRLIGHLSIGAQMLEERIKRIEGFPSELEQKVLHMLLAHHGELEKGSPTLPAFAEAVALYHADYGDAYVKHILQEIEAGTAGEEWVYSKPLNRFLQSREKRQ